MRPTVALARLTLHDDAVEVEIRTLALDPPGVDVAEVRWG